MSIIAKINKFFWTRSLSVFDMIAVITISNLMVNVSWWWALAYLATIPISVHFQLFTERTQS